MCGDTASNYLGIRPVLPHGFLTCTQSQARCGAEWLPLPAPSRGILDHGSLDGVADNYCPIGTKRAGLSLCERDKARWHRCRWRRLCWMATVAAARATIAIAATAGAPTPTADAAAAATAGDAPRLRRNSGRWRLLGWSGQQFRRRRRLLGPSWWLLWSRCCRDRSGRCPEMRCGRRCRNLRLVRLGDLPGGKHADQLGERCAVRVQIRPVASGVARHQSTAFARNLRHCNGHCGSIEMRTIC